MGLPQGCVCVRARALPRPVRFSPVPAAAPAGGGGAGAPSCPELGRARPRGLVDSRRGPGWELRALILQPGLFFDPPKCGSRRRVGARQGCSPRR